MPTRARCPSRGPLDHRLAPARFLGLQLFALAAGVFIAGTMFVRVERRERSRSAFDRRIVTLLAFGPVAIVLALSIVTGRGLVTLWGYPLWLFFGLWIVMASRTVVEALRVKYTAAAWAGIAATYIVGFIVHYGDPCRSAPTPITPPAFRATRLPGMSPKAFATKTGKPLDLRDLAPCGSAAMSRVTRRASDRTC